MTCLRLTALLALLGLPAFSAPPNIVLIVADDLGWNDVGYHGSKNNRTPNIDALAEKGLKLERFYAYPMCNPTRRALMTGRSAVTIQGMAAKAELANGHLPLELGTMPQLFREAGYQAFMTGKWHLGNQHVDYFPTERGFHSFLGFTNAGIDFFSHIARGGLDWQRDGKSVREEGYSTELFTQEAVNRIRGRDKTKPMLLYVAYNAVHTPLQAPEKYMDRVADLPEGDGRTYAAMALAMDDGVGEILAALESEGIDENTLVVFISDNGGSRAGDNSPLRGGKTQTFEGGIRVPAAVWMKGRIEGRGATEQYVTMHDWLPTFAAAADVEVPWAEKLYGKNLWPALSEGRAIDNDEFLIGHQGNFAVFENGMKFVRNRGEDFLFDIEKDPHETKDLKGEQPELAARLAAEIEAFPGADAVAAQAGRGPGRGRRPGGPGGAGRPGGRGQFGPQTEETREPWAEAAARE